MCASRGCSNYNLITRARAHGLLASRNIIKVNGRFSFVVELASYIASSNASSLESYTVLSPCRFLTYLSKCARAVHESERTISFRSSVHRRHSIDAFVIVCRFELVLNYGVQLIEYIESQSRLGECDNGEVGIAKTCPAAVVHSSVCLPSFLCAIKRSLRRRHYHSKTG